MRTWQIILIISVLYGLFTEGQKWLRHRQQAKILSQVMTSGALGLATAGIPQNCAGKKYCVTVFVAPWCGVCLSSEPTFKAIQKYLPLHRTDVGFGLVIGTASASENSQKQKDLMPIESYVDDSGDIMSLRQIQAFPTWITTNENGQEVFRQAGGFQVSSEEQIPQILALVLGSDR